MIGMLEKRKYRVDLN